MPAAEVRSLTAGKRSFCGDDRKALERAVVEGNWRIRRLCASTCETLERWRPAIPFLLKSCAEHENWRVRRAAAKHAGPGLRSQSPVS